MLLRKKLLDCSSLRCNLVYSGRLNLANAWIPVEHAMLKYLINKARSTIRHKFTKEKNSRTTGERGREPLGLPLNPLLFL